MRPRQKKMKLVQIFSLNVRARRRNLRMTQQDLADSTGLSLKTINKIETEFENVTLQSVEVIAAALKTSASLLVLQVSNKDEKSSIAAKCDKLIEEIEKFKVALS